jgi:hypothetical protein
MVQVCEGSSGFGDVFGFHGCVMYFATCFPIYAAII